MYTISDDTADEDLPQVWAGFIKRINNSTEWDLNEKNTLSTDQLILRINPPKDGKPESHEKAKKVWRDALKFADRLGIFVQRFGQFIVQGTSIVFGPSQQCFNAISFVITAAQKYKEVFANITVLMERISVFLENLNIFMDDTDAEVKLDKRLRKTVYRVLEHFVVILGTTHKLTTDWKARAKLAMKNFAFGEDENIKGSLETLETLISDFTNTSITVIVKDLGDAARNIRGVEKKVDEVNEKADKLIDSSEKQTTMLTQLTATDDKNKAREQEQKDLDALTKALGADETKKSADRQTELWEDHVPGTGQWLLERPSFSKWADPLATAVDCFTLKAPSGFGKSYLTSIVTHHLQDKHRESTRVFVSYYYFQKEPGDRSPLFKALKSVIWQVAKSSREYLKLAAKAFDGRVDFSKPGELWRLAIDIAKNLDATFFVILDGLEELPEDIITDLLDVINQIMTNSPASAEKAPRFKVRIFLSGTRQMMDRLKDSASVTLPEINIEVGSNSEQTSLNETDIQLYIEDQLNRMDRFDKSESDRKNHIKSVLSNGVRGDYSQLRWLLNDIRVSQYESEIEAVLKRASQSRADLIASKVQLLNTSLDKKEIRDINELLNWVTASFENLKINEYEAVLSLREDPPKSLSKQLTDRYNVLFEMDDDSKEVTLKDGVEDYLKQLNDHIANGLAAANTRPAESLQEPEIALVRKVLQTHFRNVFGDEAVYSKFGFDEFFEKKLGDQAVRVHLNQNESHTIIAQACLEAMCDQYSEPDTHDLLRYAYKWFVEHIQAIKPDGIDTVTKQDIGRKLVRLLREPALIESWWTADRMYLKMWFVYGDYCRELLGVINSWLKDPIVLKGMSDMPSERQWVTAITSSDPPSFELYANVATMMAKRWLLSTDDEEWKSAFSWLRGWFLVSRGGIPDEDDYASPQLISDIESWAKGEVASYDEDLLHERLARTFDENECWPEAAEQYREAVNRRPYEWKLQMDLAAALGMNKNYEDAISTLEDMMQSKHDLLGSDEEYTTQYWTNMLLYLSGWNMERKDFAAAEKACVNVLEHCFERNEYGSHARGTTINLLNALNSQGRFAESVGLLRTLSEYNDSKGNNWLVLLFQERSDDDIFHKHLSAAARRSKLIEDVAEHYQHAIEVTRSQEEMVGVVQALERFFGALLWAGGSPEEQEMALKLWQQAIAREPSGDEEIDYFIYYNRRYSVRNLAPALLSRAKAAGLAKGLNPDIFSIITMMEKLVNLDYGWTVAFTGSDPRMILARLYHLSGDPKRAKRILRDHLKIAIQEAENQSVANQINDGFYKIAVALQAIDDENNALTAWAQYMPNNPRNGDSSAETAPEDEGLAGANGTVLSDGQAEPGAERNLTNGDVHASEERSNGLVEENEAKTKNETATNSSRIKLQGSLGNNCDGECGVSWSYVDDIYVCKDCLDIQFDPVCYNKLKEGELDVPVCSPNHDHIHIPPFDEALWRSMPKDSVMTDGTLMLREEWLESIKLDWQLDAESLESEQRVAEAAHKIQAAWKTYSGLTKGIKRLAINGT